MEYDEFRSPFAPRGAGISGRLLSIFSRVATQTLVTACPAGYDLFASAHRLLHQANPFG